MIKNYSDIELLTALQNWQNSVSKKLKQINQKNNKKDINSIKLSLQKIKKEIKKQSKNSSTDWNIIWNNIVGKEIADNTRIKRWHNGFLEIIVDNPVLRSELDAFFKDSLIESLKESADKKRIIRGIKFISS